MPEVTDRWHRTDRATGARVRTDRYGVGRRWLARWRDDTGATQARIDRRSDSERFLVEVGGDLDRGAYINPWADRTTVWECGEQWRAVQVHQATTAAQVETHLRRHVYPTFGDRAVASVRPSEVQAWIRSLEQHLAPATIGVVYSFLDGIFRAAVRDRLIVASPCVDVRLPKPVPKRVEPLAMERVEALIAADARAQPGAGRPSRRNRVTSGRGVRPGG